MPVGAPPGGPPIQPFVVKSALEEPVPVQTGPELPAQARTEEAEEAPSALDRPVVSSEAFGSVPEPKGQPQAHSSVSVAAKKRQSMEFFQNLSKKQRSAQDAVYIEGSRPVVRTGSSVVQKYQPLRESSSGIKRTCEDTVGGDVSQLVAQFKSRRQNRPELDGKGSRPDRERGSYEGAERPPRSAGSLSAKSLSKRPAPKAGSASGAPSKGRAAPLSRSGPLERAQGGPARAGPDPAAQWTAAFLKVLRAGETPSAEATGLTGHHQRGTIRLLEKQARMQQRLRGLAQAEAGDGPELADDRLHTYPWTGQTAAALLRLEPARTGSTLCQVFGSGEFAGAPADPLFASLPAAVGLARATREHLGRGHQPFALSADGSAVLVGPATRLGDLLDWAEGELMLPCWSRLRPEDEEGGAAELSLSFTLSAELASGALAETACDSLAAFFRLQYRKVLLDAVASGAERVLLVLPEDPLVAGVAHAALRPAVEHCRPLLPRSMHIYMPDPQ